MNKKMDTFGEVLRTIRFDNGANMVWYNDVIYYEAAVIDDNGTEMLYIRVTNTRFDNDVAKSGEQYGIHFNCKLLSKHQQDWFAIIIGDTMAKVADESIKRTHNDIKRNMNALLTSVGSNIKLGTFD